MKTSIKVCLRAGMVVLALSAAGCGAKRPIFTPAEGTVTLDGRPLPYARVEFVPLLKGFGAEFNSVGITDEHGHFTLSCGGQAGAAVAKHRVVVQEGPLPPQARGQSEEAQNAFAEHMAKMKNRPIPPRYGSVVSTPLELEVTAGQSTYNLVLTGP
jgi:hypothetical protein